jgi:hypothetical protein
MAASSPEFFKTRIVFRNTHKEFRDGNERGAKPAPRHMDPDSNVQYNPPLHWGVAALQHRRGLRQHTWPSAMAQAVPELGKTFEHVPVFGRTGIWSLVKSGRDHIIMRARFFQLPSLFPCNTTLNLSDAVARAAHSVREA